MAVFFAYLIVVLVWATTPLAIQWSSDSVSFMAAVVMRMSLALALALVATILLRRELFHQRGSWKVYLAASFGIFPNMPVVYWSAQFIPSGLIAVIFALSPFVTGLMSLLILKENPFNRRRILALLMALSGLLIIFYDQLRIDPSAGYGIAGILLSCFLFSFSSVSLKRLNKNADAFSQMTGALLFALPGLLLSWWLIDGQLPETYSDKTLGSVIYLAIMGSLLGFTLFFYVLKHLSASVVSLITLITPVLALFIGTTLAGEQFSAKLFWGAGLVLLALLVYIDVSTGHWFEKCLRRRTLDGCPFEESKQSVFKYK